MVTSTWFASSAIRANQELKTTMARLHDELIEKVILNAQSGDQEGTYAAMELAKISDVPDTTRQMLKGIVHYYNGDNASAVRILENVIELEPMNVTARAMLALSYGHNGGWIRYFREILQIQKAVGATERKDYESLILGCALMYLDTTRCVKSLEFHAGKTIDEFDEDCGETPIGRVEFHYHVAMRKLSEGDREGAIRHFDECAESIVPMKCSCQKHRASRILR